MLFFKPKYVHKKVIGKVEKGTSGHVRVKTGMLNIGEASGAPIIRNLLGNSKAKEEATTFVDCPLGSACIEFPFYDKRLLSIPYNCFKKL